MVRRPTFALSVIAAVASLWLGLLAPSADADFGIAKWEAGTCAVDATPVAPCTYASPEASFFTQAAGHPPFGITDFSVNTTGGLLSEPEGNVKDVRVDLPEGLNVNPQATPQCPKAEFEASPANCVGSEVGVSYVTSSLLPAPLPFTVYNLEPDFGAPALFGFNVDVLLVNADVYLVADVATDSDYHEGFTISEVPNAVPLVENRLVFKGDTGGDFLTLGSQCDGPEKTGLKVDSYQNPGQFLSYSTTPPAQIGGCHSVPFAPEIEVGSESPTTDSPSGAQTNVDVPQASVDSSTLRTAKLTLPRGLGLNPAAAPGLQACSDEQFGVGVKKPSNCPPASKIGVVSIQTPVLPPNSLPGEVYLGSQQSRDPASGNVAWTPPTLSLQAADFVVASVSWASSQVSLTSFGVR
jgi:hypothetical protein